MTSILPTRIESDSETTDTGSVLAGGRARLIGPQSQHGGSIGGGFSSATLSQSDSPSFRSELSVCYRFVTSSLLPFLRRVWQLTLSVPHRIKSLPMAAKLCLLSPFALAALFLVWMSLYGIIEYDHYVLKPSPDFAPVWRVPPPSLVVAAAAADSSSPLTSSGQDTSVLPMLSNFSASPQSSPKFITFCRYGRLGNNLFSLMHAVTIGRFLGRRVILHEHMISGSANVDSIIDTAHLRAFEMTPLRPFEEELLTHEVRYRVPKDATIMRDEDRARMEGRKRRQELRRLQRKQALASRLKAGQVSSALQAALLGSQGNASNTMTAPTESLLDLSAEELEEENADEARAPPSVPLVRPADPVLRKQYAVLDAYVEKRWDVKLSTLTEVVSANGTTPSYGRDPRYRPPRVLVKDIVDAEVDTAASPPLPPLYSTTTRTSISEPEARIAFTPKSTWMKKAAWEFTSGRDSCSASFHRGYCVGDWGVDPLCDDNYRDGCAECAVSTRVSGKRLPQGYLRQALMLVPDQILLLSARSVFIMEDPFFLCSGAQEGDSPFFLANHSPWFRVLHSLPQFSVFHGMVRYTPRFRKEILAAAEAFHEDMRLRAGPLRTCGVHIRLGDFDTRSRLAKFVFPDSSGLRSYAEQVKLFIQSRECGSIFIGTDGSTHERQYLVKAAQQLLPSSSIFTDCKSAATCQGSGVRVAATEMSILALVDHYMGSIKVGSTFSMFIAHQRLVLKQGITIASFTPTEEFLQAPHQAPEWEYCKRLPEAYFADTPEQLPLNPIEWV